VEAKQLTIVEYIKKYNPGQFEYLPDSPSFTSEELWLDFKKRGTTWCRSFAPMERVFTIPRCLGGA
jgi:hypothetical protein